MFFVTSQKQRNHQNLEFILIKKTKGNSNLKLLLSPYEFIVCRHKCDNNLSFKVISYELMDV